MSGVKKSNFVAESTIGSADTLDFVSNGQNKKISFENFLALVGAIGTLVAKGEVTAIPILNKDGTENQIRNILGKSGIIASVSPQGGVQLDHNFTADSVGVPVLTDQAETSPVIRSILAGSGITVASSGDAIQIAASGVPVASNIVIVNQMSDFPAAVAGVITLADDTAYLVSAALSTTDRFVLGDNTIVYGADSAVSSLAYTGTGVMFTQASPDSTNAKITLLAITCENGTLFDVDGGGTGIFQMVNATVTKAKNLGNITDCLAVQIVDVAFSDITTSGITFSGNMGLFIGVRNLLSVSGGTIFDLNSCVFSSGFSLETCFVIMGAGTKFIDGAVDSANMAAGALGAVFNTRINNSGGTVLTAISETDSRWEFKLNDEIPDSKTSLLALKDTTTITIATVSTPVIVGTTWTAKQDSRWTLTAGGRFTYKGKGEKLEFSGAVSATGTVPSSRDYEFLLYKNGTAITDAVFKRSFSNTGSGSVSVVWEESLATDDYIELFVQNTTNDDNITVNSVILGIRG
jgi:hypothetical protein